MDVRVNLCGRPLEKARLERGRRYIKTRFDGGLVPPPTQCKKRLSEALVRRSNTP